jgi:hypothetical protein
VQEHKRLELDIEIFCPNQYKPSYLYCTPSKLDEQSQNLLVDGLRHWQLARQVGAFARLIDLFRLRMANHAGGWAPGALVRFGSLDFIGGGLEQIRVPVQPAHTTNLNPVVEAFEGMRLRALEDRVSEDSGPLDFDYESLGSQLRVFLGPRSTQEDLHHVLFSLANVMAQLSKGEPLSPEIPTRGIPVRFPFGLCSTVEDVCRLAAAPFGSSLTKMASSWDDGLHLEILP